MEQTHLLHHWNFPRARAGAKPRAIATLRCGALMARQASRASPSNPLCATGALPSATLGGARWTACQAGHEKGCGRCREPARGNAEVCRAAAANRRDGAGCVLASLDTGLAPSKRRVSTIATDTRWRAWTRLDA